MDKQQLIGLISQGYTTALELETGNGQAFTSNMRSSLESAIKSSPSLKPSRLAGTIQATPQIKKDILKQRHSRVQNLYIA